MDDEILIEEEVQEEEVQEMPVLRSPSYTPIITNQVTNGYARDVLGIASDILIQYPNSQYMLFGNSHLSWVLVVADRYDDEELTFDGHLRIFHIYQAEYLPDNHALTWFLECDYLPNNSYQLDDDTEDYLYYASFGDNPRISEVVQNADIQAAALWRVLLPFCIISIVLQQIFRRFG